MKESTFNDNEVYDPSPTISSDLETLKHKE
jgi:hypothetical protein